MCTRPLFPVLMDGCTRQPATKTMRGSSIYWNTCVYTRTHAVSKQQPNKDLTHQPHRFDTNK